MHMPMSVRVGATSIGGWASVSGGLARPWLDVEASVLTAPRSSQNRALVVPLKDQRTPCRCQAAGTADERPPRGGWTLWRVSAWDQVCHGQIAEPRDEG